MGRRLRDFRIWGDLKKREKERDCGSSSSDALRPENPRFVADKAPSMFGR
jgi:hypothetical protein